MTATHLVLLRQMCIWYKYMVSNALTFDNIKKNYLSFLG